MARAATTATRARRRTPARVAPAPALIPSPAPRPTSVTCAGTCDRATVCARTRRRRTAPAAATGTRARRRTPARAASAPAAIRSRAPRPISVTVAGTCDPPRVCARTRRRRTAPGAATETLHADRYLPGGVCTGGNSGHVHRVRSMPRRGTCDPATGMCSNPTAANGIRVQRRERLHADRYLPGRRLHRRQSRDLHGDPISATSPARCNPATGMCSNPTGGERHRLQATGTPARRPTAARRRLHRRKSVTCTASDQCHVAGTCRPGHGLVLQPDGGGTARVATTAMPARRPTRARPASASAPIRHLHRVGSVPRRRDVRSGDRGMCSNPTAANGTGCNERKRLHADRHVPGPASAPAALPSRAPRPTSVMAPGRAIRRRACAPTRPWRTARVATTATPAPSRIRARPACAPAPNPVTCTASDQSHVAGTC
jgi:hypothetical protein